MTELFRLKIAAKRQLTLPQQLLSALDLAEGDEIRIRVEGGRIVAVQPCKSVPTSLLPDELLSKLRAREKLLTEGKGIGLDEALEKISVRT